MSSISQWFRRRRSRWNCIEERLQQLETDMQESKESIARTNARLEIMEGAIDGVSSDLAKVLELLAQGGSGVDPELKASILALESRFKTATDKLVAVDASYPPAEPPDEPAESSKVAPPIERDRSVKDWS